MNEWFENVTINLSTSQPSPKRLGSAISLMCCVTKCFNLNYISDFKEDVMIALLRMMAFTYTAANMEYSFLQSLMKKKESKLVINFIFTSKLVCVCREQVTESITSLFTYATDKLNKRKEYFIDLMKALPLIHFVRDDRIPYEKLDVSPSKVVWGDKRLKIASVQSSMHHQTR